MRMYIRARPIERAGGGLLGPPAAGPPRGCRGSPHAGGRRAARERGMCAITYLRKAGTRRASARAAAAGRRRTAAAGVCMHEGVSDARMLAVRLKGEGAAWPDQIKSDQTRSGLALAPYISIYWQQECKRETRQGGASIHACMRYCACMPPPHMKKECSDRKRCGLRLLRALRGAGAAASGSRRLHAPKAADGARGGLQALTR